MTAASYDIVLNIAERRLRLRLDGYWNQEIGDRFTVEIETAMRKMQALTKRFDLLIDVSKSPAQTQGIANQRRAMLQTAKSLGATRFATVSGDAILNLQTKRIGDDTVATFASETDAVAWLDSERAKEDARS